MKKMMTKREAKEFKKRWAFVNQFEVEELRKTSVLIKLRQLAALMFAVNPLGWKKALSHGETDVRRRWHRLRKAYNV